ncbi:MAG TPA: response regulator [Alphaproteobacteria bacterium]|nr:response regulator [Alphaproteobacteria bacterium]
MALHFLKFHKAPRAVAPPATKRILFVEDSGSDVAYVSHVLKNHPNKYSYDVSAVPTLLDALRQLKDESFDLILLDLNLVDVSGVVTVSALHAEAPEVPILVYSGVSDLMWRERAVKKGAAGYLVKGCDEGASLGHAIEATLRRLAA